MALLKLNGVEVQATASEWEPVTLGETVRSLNGAPRSTARVRKANLRYTSSLLTVPEAQLLRALVEGEGHVLSFEDSSTATSHLYTSRMTFPATSTAGTARSTSEKKWGSAGLTVAAGSSLWWNVGFTGTFLGWVKEASGPWRHIIDNGTQVFIDGVAAASSPYQYGWMVNNVVWIGDVYLSGVATAFDDVVALPYVVPAEWVPAVYAFHSARAWPALPYVLAEGPRLPSAGLLCLGEVGNAKAMPLRDSVAEVFDFTLHGT